MSKDVERAKASYEKAQRKDDMRRLKRISQLLEKVGAEVTAGEFHTVDVKDLINRFADTIEHPIAEIKGVLEVYNNEQ